MGELNVKEKFVNMEVKYFSTKDIYDDACNIIESARNYTYNAVNVALVERNWLLGYRISEEELNGKDRADYGKEVIKNLSKKLMEKYGNGFDKKVLYKYVQFYKMFPEIVASVRRQFGRLLSWTHYRVLITVSNDDARKWYEKEALNEMWSVRTLERNIETQYYFRMLSTPKKGASNKDKKQSYEDNKLEFIKNPVITEFLGLPISNSFHENDL